jgi:hypothetical protein
MYHGRAHAWRPWSAWHLHRSSLVIRGRLPREQAFTCAEYIAFMFQERSVEEGRAQSFWLAMLQSPLVQKELNSFGEVILRVSLRSVRFEV